MFRWCAYCWRFLGEREPLADYSPTHGICLACSRRDALTDHQAIERTRPIAELHRRMMHVARTGSDADVGSLLDHAHALQLRPLDILVGVLQPALYELGRLWDVGEIEPATEARFSRFCERALEEMEMEQRRRVGVLAGEPIFLLPAEGNRHTIGMRMFGFTLREAGRDARVLPEMPDLEWLGRLCAILRPSVIGVSVSMPRQIEYVARIAQVAEVRMPWCRVVAGGFGLRDGTTLPDGVSYWHRLEDILGAETTTPDRGEPHRRGAR